jgi:hypothetical protein
MDSEPGAPMANISGFLAWLILGLSAILGIIFQILMIANRKPGMALFQERLLFNPFHMQFRGSYYLTSTGIYWRNLSWICCGIFVVTIAWIRSVFSGS